MTDTATPPVSGPTALYDEHPSMFRNHPIWFSISVLLIALFGLGVLILVIWYITAKGTRLTVTQDEMTLEVGIFNKSHKDIRIDRIRSVRIDQTFFQRMLNTGTITAYTTGDVPEISVSGMPNPEIVRNIVRTHTHSRDPR